MNARAVYKLLSPIKRAIGNACLRGVLVMHEGAKVQIKTFDGTQDAEIQQQFGFISSTVAGAEAIAMAVRGHRTHTVVISTRDRRYEIPLASGESAQVDAFGQKVHLSETGIHLQSPMKVTIESPQNEIIGDTTLTGTLTVTVDVVAAGISSVHHKHKYNPGVGSAVDSWEPTA